MTVKITSLNHIGLVAGTGAEIDAYRIPEYTTDDIHPKNRPTANLTSMLRQMQSVRIVGAMTIDGTVAASTTLYTVPSGQILMTVRLMFVVTAIAGSGAAPAISVGFTGFDRDLIDSTFNPGLFDGMTAAGRVLSVDNFEATGGNNSILSGGDSLRAQVDTAATYSEYAVRCFIFGFQTGSSDQSSITDFNDYGTGLYGEGSY